MRFVAAGWSLPGILLCLPSRTIALWHRCHEADRVAIDELITNVRRRYRASADLFRDYIKVQGRRLFNVIEIVTEVIGISVETWIDFFWSVVHRHLACCLERNIH